jgi:DNA-binding MarR family transcriptional regulator
MRFTEMFTELVRLEITLWNGLDDHLRSAAGLSLAQYQALGAIRKHGEAARVQEISREMSITVGATSKVVDRLERDGLAVRTAHPSDRRSSIVSTSERGATALAEADSVVEGHLRHVLGDSLTADGAERLRDELTSLGGSLRVRDAK